MKARDLKALLPGAPLLVAALVLGVAAFWYLQRAEQQADHIVRRNFNHLNQIAANIATVREGLQSQVFFECKHALAELQTRKTPQGARTHKVDEALTEIFGRLGPARVQIAEPVSESDDQAEGNEKEKAASAHPRPTTCKEDSTGTSLKISTLGTDLATGGLESRFLLTIDSKSEGVDEFELAITKSYELIEGLDLSAGYFDAILLGAHGSKGSWVYYNTAVASVSVPEDDILALFDATHDYARFGSLAAFAQATRIFELELEEIASNGRAGSADDRAGETWSSQSRLLSIPVGSERKRAFSQPLTLPFLAPANLSSAPEDSLRPVIIGLMEEAEFNRLKFQLPLNVVLVLVLLLLAGILSFSLLRLKLLAGHAVLRRIDVVLACFSTAGLAILTTVMLSNGLASWFLSAQYKADLEQIHDEILSSFYAERGEKLAYLRQVVESAARNREADSAPLYTPRGAANALLAPRDDVAEVHTWTTGGLPIFTELFLLDGTGTNVGNFVTFDRKNEGLEPGFKVPSREYFRALNEGRAWRASAEGAHRRYYMQRIEDLVSGVLRTALSIEVRSGEIPPGDDTDSRAHMLVGTTQFHSLAHTAMPPGYGFAVFDRLSGDVLFHSDRQRNLRENLYRATDDAPLLKAAVIANLERKQLIDLSYKGASITARLAPLRGTDWELLTFYDRGLVDIVNFRFSAAILGVSALALFAIPLASAGLAAVWLAARGAYSLRVRNSFAPARLPPRVFPTAAGAGLHRTLTLYYAFLLWLYAGVILVFDIGSGYLWWLYVLLASPLLWWLLCRRSGGDTAGSGNDQARAAAAPRGKDEAPRRPARVLYFLLRDLGMIASGRASLSLPFLTFTAAWLALVFVCSPEGNRSAFPYALATSAAVGLLGVLLLVPQYASATAAAGDARGNPRESAFNAASLAWYRLQLCLLLLLLAVAPALQLQNDSYDVHERSWWDFHSWAVGERLTARNRALQHYVDDLGTAPDLRLDHWLWLTAVEDGGRNRHGLYLPRFSINEPEKSKADPERIGLTVVPSAGRAVGADHRSGTKAQRQHLTDQLEQRVDTWWLSDAARRSPTFSTIGATLREFIGVDQRLQTDSVEDRQDRGRGETVHGTWGKGYLADQLDERTGLLFQFDYFYPHTRAHPIWAAGFHFLMILVAAAVVLLLLGFVFRRVFLTRELQNEAPWDDGALTNEGSSAVLIVPASCEPGAVLERLEAAVLEGAANARDEPARLRGGTVLEFETRRLLLVADLVTAVSDREASEDTLEFIEDARAAGLTVILLSDVHPAYWLEHLTDADGVCDPTVIEWERSLRRLAIYRYRDRHDATDGAVDYRRVWERSSKDEQLVLASVFYEGLAHTLNPDTLESLVNRGILSARDHHLEFADAFLGEEGDDWGRFVHANLPRSEFLRQARRHETGLWRAVRGPFVLVLLTLLAFLAYVARDELQGLLSLAAGLGATMAALSTVGERWRAFMGSLGGGSASGG